MQTQGDTAEKEIGACENGSGRICKAIEHLTALSSRRDALLACSICRTRSKHLVELTFRRESHCLLRYWHGVAWGLLVRVDGGAEVLDYDAAVST